MSYRTGVATVYTLLFSYNSYRHVNYDFFQWKLSTIFKYKLFNRYYLQITIV